MWLSVRDECLERRLVDVVLELLLTEGDVDDLVDALEAHVEYSRVSRDHRDRDRPAELLRRRHELARELPQLAPQVFGDDQGAVQGGALTSAAPRRSP